MKKYKVKLIYKASVEVEFIAESQEEAIEKAENTEFALNQLCLERNASEIISEEESESLQDIIGKAENIIKKAEEEDVDFHVKYWPSVSIKNFDFFERDEIVESKLIETFYFDNDYEEIGFHVEGLEADFCLSELSEADQLIVCNSIISNAKSNGIEC